MKKLRAIFRLIYSKTYYLVTQTEVGIKYPEGKPIINIVTDSNMSQDEYNTYMQGYSEALKILLKRNAAKEE